MYSVILASLLLASGALAKSDCVDRSLSFRPYSSSYLPWNKGDLVNTKGSKREASQIRKVASDVAQKYASTSALERLDALNLLVLGRDTSYAKSLKSEFYRPGKPNWSGFCDRWANGSLNKAMIDLIENAGDIVCKGVLIKNGELKELVTGLYRSESAGGTRAGKTAGSDAEPAGLDNRYFGKPTADESAYFSTSGGVDRMPVERFDQMISRSLSADEGLILNVTNVREVWNQPVYKSTRCESDVTADKIGVGNLPVQLLKSPNAEINAWLRSAASRDQNVVVGLIEDFDFKEAAEQMADDLKKLQASAMDPAVRKIVETRLASLKGSLNYAKVRAVERSLMKDLSNTKLVTADPDLKFAHVSNKLQFGDEVDYAADGHSYDHRDYEYYLARDSSGKVVKGFWKTPFSKRPGTLWVPSKLKEETWPQPLKDLVTVIGKCKDDPEFRQHNAKEIVEALRRKKTK